MTRSAAGRRNGMEREDLPRSLLVWDNAARLSLPPAVVQIVLIDIDAGRKHWTLMPLAQFRLLLSKVGQAA